MRGLSMFSNRFKINEKVTFSAVGLMWGCSLAFSWLHDNNDSTIPIALTVGSLVSVWAWRKSSQKNKELLEKIMDAT